MLVHKRFVTGLFLCCLLVTVFATNVFVWLFIVQWSRRYVVKILQCCLTSAVKTLAPLLLAASGTYSIGDWILSGCVSSNFFQITTPPTVFVRFSQTLAHMICVPVCKKTVEQVYEILISKFWTNFWNFTFAAAAVQLSAI